MNLISAIRGAFTDKNLNRRDGETEYCAPLSGLNVGLFADLLGYLLRAVQT